MEYTATAGSQKAPHSAVDQLADWVLDDGRKGRRDVLR